MGIRKRETVIAGSNSSQMFVSGLPKVPTRSVCSLESTNRPCQTKHFFRIGISPTF
jgi:hypothetical protein